MNKRVIKVGILVSYDYELIRNSLPPIYKHADKIVLAVDKDGKTWSGNNISVSETFWEWVKDFDTQHKIEIYKDSFYVQGLTSMQCDTRERTLLGRYMGDGGWHIQLDADEYFIDFKAFVDFLHELDCKAKHIDCIEQEWLALYKKTANGYLFVKGSGGRTPIATTKPENYICARITSNPTKTVYTQRVIHDSWARTEQDLYTKLTNWSHNKDFDIEGYFHYWKGIDEKNYMFIRHFHPIAPQEWQELRYIAAKNIPELLQKLRESQDDELLKSTKQVPKLTKFLQLCIPPLFAAFSQWRQSRKQLNRLKKQTRRISSL